jgi:hypothetical protein
MPFSLSEPSLDMNEAKPIDSTPYASQHLPFANELEVQQFVEEYAENIFGLMVISRSVAGDDNR